jgi:hypothetical protein
MVKAEGLFRTLTDHYSWAMLESLYESGTKEQKS